MVAKLERQRLESTVRMPDGRKIGVAEFGDPNGVALLWLHGIPGGRHQIPPAVREFARERGVRVIGIDRPGIGRSTGHLYRRVRHFADDVAVVLDALGIERTGVVGMSGGGAYAQAVAHQLPDRVVGLALLCSVAPGVGDHKAPNGVVNDLARVFRVPMLVLRRPVGGMMWVLVKGMAPFKDQLADTVISRMPGTDAEIMSEPSMRKMFINDFVGNSRRQSQAMMNDTVLLGRHWGFDIRDIRVPTAVWMGTEDWIVPPHHGEHLAAMIPGATLHVGEGDGHFAGLAQGERVMDYIVETHANAQAAVPV